ncbi:heme-NO-binding protein [Yoonia maritima]|uniref:Heme-NO-binding protein n=1 Tax=Yoonia maritima TaxID=1435347 RepID=A0A2T0VYC0_9RHOB|nr:heme NO-binding domain-containing protein [Yoonia maritima]PRY77199.1 heme-NO-binding protein [Yoonia maritima]
MKGTVFVELIKMAEEAFGEDVVDDMLDKTDLENDGAFTTVGNYPCADLFKITKAFSYTSGLSEEELERRFGAWMLDHFGENYPHFFTGKPDSFAILEAINGEIQVEVRKLYPDAELPEFEITKKSAKHFEMTYSSQRPIAEFCHGLIEACVKRFGQTADIQRASALPPDGSTTFQIVIR